jgi:hypothetical protein
MKIKYPKLNLKTKRKAKRFFQSSAKPKTKKVLKPKSSFVLCEDSVAYVVNNLDLITLEEAARVTGKTTHNIRDYIQRGRIAKLNTDGRPIKQAVTGELRVSLKEVKAFLYLVSQRDEKHHHAGLHPELGFYGVAERERTKHVNRLHPYHPEKYTRWTSVECDPVHDMLVQNDLWNAFAGEEIFDDLLSVFQEVGDVYREHLQKLISGRSK